jgi:hypothetical protein
VAAERRETAAFNSGFSEGDSYPFVRPVFDGLVAGGANFDHDVVTGAQVAASFANSHFKSGFLRRVAHSWLAIAGDRPLIAGWRDDIENFRQETPPRGPSVSR